MVESTSVAAFVPGHPATLTAERSTAEPWKQAIAAAVGAQWSGGYISEPCSIDLIFDLRPDRYRSTAVFNLLKATIDGVANAVFAPATGGGQPGPWHREDWWITQLTATKREAEEPGVSIRLLIPPGADPEPRGGHVLMDATVPGRAPVWASAGDKEARWREQLVAIARPVNADAIDIWLGFSLGSDRYQQTDLDNLVVPAAQAAGASVFGHLRSGTRVRSVRAVKRVAASEADIATHVVVTESS